MNDESFVRDRIRDAREEMGLSQRDMAKLFKTSQSRISEIERGRVQLTVRQLLRFAQIFGKPIPYFFPSHIGKDITAIETELLDSFYGLPEPWQRDASLQMKTRLEFYDQVVHYLSAGIPLKDLEDLMYSEFLPVEDGDEGIRLGKVELEILKRLLRRLRASNPEPDFEGLLNGLGRLETKVRQEFFESDHPVAEEDQKEGELHLANLKRFVAWLKYLQLKYEPDTEGQGV